MNFGEFGKKMKTFSSFGAFCGNLWFIYKADHFIKEKDTPTDRHKDRNIQRKKSIETERQKETHSLSVTQLGGQVLSCDGRSY